MGDWIGEYTDTEDLNEKYKLLREEVKRLRALAGGNERFKPEDVAETVRQLNKRFEGHLIVFAANDFGLPIALRPEEFDTGVQNQVRETILENKYDQHADLDKARSRILRDHPKVHKAIVAEHDNEDVRYHLPEGSNDNTNFITVREMVGLVDYTTNSFQSESLSVTY